MALIGRTAELARLEANLARGRHTLLTGPVGIGKSHLLRVLQERRPAAIHVETIKPLRMTLLALCQALHVRQALVLPDAGAAALAWPECARHLGRLNIRELTDVLVASLRGRGLTLILDQLEGVTSSIQPVVERLLAEAVVVGATSRLPASCRKLWWAFDQVEVPPLEPEEVRRLLWTLTSRSHIADPEMFEAAVLNQAAGNPLAVAGMVKQVAGASRVSRQAIRDLYHGAGVRYFDLTPVVLLIGAGLIAARFVALGLNDTDLYIIAGSLGALFVVARYLLARSSRASG